jgi:hypothetical protein
VRARYTNVLIVLGGGALAAILLIRALLTDGLQRPPRTIQEAVVIANSKELCCISDEPDGIPHVILVVSETPLTWAEAASLRVNSPKHPGWRGVTKIQGSRSVAAENYDPTCSAVWGSLFVYGDPEVIRKLTGTLPQ